MSMIYKRTADYPKQKQAVPECLTSTTEPRDEADAERRRKRKRSCLLLDVEQQTTDSRVGSRRRVGDDSSALFDPTENWLLSEVAAAQGTSNTSTTTTATTATDPFTSARELNYYSTPSNTDLDPTLESSFYSNNFDKCGNFGTQFSGGTFFEDMSMSILFNRNNNNDDDPTTTTTTNNNNNNNQNLNFKNMNLLCVGSKPSTESGTYNIYKSEELGLAFGGILSPPSSTTTTTATTQSERIMPDTRVHQFNPSPTTKGNPQFYNIYPGVTDGNYLPYNNNNDDDVSNTKIKRKASPQSNTTNFSHFPVSFPQAIIPDQRRVTRQIIKPHPSRVHTTKRDKRLEVTPVVFSDNNPNIYKNKTTDQAKPPSNYSTLKSNKKDTNIPQMVPFLREGNSVYNFFNDADLKRMVGDLRTQMSMRGLCVFDNFLGVEKGKLVLKDVVNLYKKGCFVNGQLESSSPAAPFLDSTRVIRGDIIKWLDGDEPDCGNIKYLMERIDATVMMCGEQMFSGYTIKHRTRAMVACYPGNGTHYLRHIDNPCGNGRVLTCIYYLNRNWDVRTDGGLLRIYPRGIDEVANIEPIFDRVLFFWSDARNPHEVKPAYKKRFAITLWYYDERERLHWQMRRCTETQTTSPSLQ